MTYRPAPVGILSLSRLPNPGARGGGCATAASAAEEAAVCHKGQGDPVDLSRCDGDVLMLGCDLLVFGHGLSGAKRV